MSAGPKETHCLYYLQLFKVFNPSGASGRLVQSFTENVVAPLQDVNQLKSFVSAFVMSGQGKRTAETAK